MQFKGVVSIQAPLEKVWQSLTDPAFVAQCAPGLEKMEVVIPDQKFRVVASIGLGSVKATFATDVEWLELEAPNHARMKAHGTAPGSGMDATSDMYLSAGTDGTTEMNWQADVVVVGSIASLASRLLGSVTQKLTNAFFNCVKAKIEA
jgi:hypothetical protein